MSVEQHQDEYAIGPDGLMYKVEANSTPPSKMHSKSTTRRFKLRYLFAGLVVLSGLLVGAQFIYDRFNKPEPGVLASVSDTVDFPIYMPQPAPEGYTVTSPSVEPANQVATYTLEGEKKIFVTLQPLPEGFDPKTRFRNNPVPSSASPIGTVYDLSEPGQKRYMVVTEKTLMFLASNEAFTDTRPFYDAINNMVSI